MHDERGIKMIKKFCHSVDLLNEWTGRIAGWLVIPLCLLVTYDVGLRYIFNRPTVWAWDVNVQFLGAMVALGGGYTLLYNGHIGVDVLVANLPIKKKAVIELITSFFFFLGVIVLVWLSIVQARISVKTREVDFTYFAPPVYPLKVVIAVGFFLLFLQGIVKLIRDLTLVLSKGERKVTDEY